MGSMTLSFTLLLLLPLPLLALLLTGVDEPVATACTRLRILRRGARTTAADAPTHGDAAHDADLLLLLSAWGIWVVLCVCESKVAPGPCPDDNAGPQCNGSVQTERARIKYFF
jgi:hypothetical protein